MVGPNVTGSSIPPVELLGAPVPWQRPGPTAHLTRGPWQSLAFLSWVFQVPRARWAEASLERITSGLSHPSEKPAPSAQVIQ